MFWTFQCAAESLDVSFKGFVIDGNVYNPIEIR